MKVGVGYSDIPDSALAGKQAAEKAVNTSGRNDPCDIALLFCTFRHNQRVLREAVTAVLGDLVTIYGGGTVGIITNDEFGYAGDQVGVACIWLDGVKCDVLTDRYLAEGDESSGFRLGQCLAKLNVTQNSPVMLLYDAVTRKTGDNICVNMATNILAGIENCMGFLPNIFGAGLQGDYANVVLTDHYT